MKLADLKFSRRAFVEYVLISIGVILLGAGLAIFLIPNKIAPGGVSGIGTVLYHLFGMPVGASMLVMNIVLFVLAFWLIGSSFGKRSVYGILLLSATIDFITYVLKLQYGADDLIMAVIFGNLLTGLGLALIFYHDASTGGTDILARIVNKYTAMDIGKALLVFDFIIAGSAGIFLKSLDTAMYSLLSVLINTYAIDAFIGLLTSKSSMLIISAKPDEIAQGILHDLNRGVTILHGEGAYTGNPQKLLLTIVNRRQMAKVRNLVRRIDPDGFIVIGHVSEVLGEGFRKSVTSI